MNVRRWITRTSDPYRPLPLAVRRAHWRRVALGLAVTCLVTALVFLVVGHARLGYRLGLDPWRPDPTSKLHLTGSLSDASRQAAAVSDDVAVETPGQFPVPTWSVIARVSPTGHHGSKASTTDHLCAWWTPGRIGLYPEPLRRMDLVHVPAGCGDGPAAGVQGWWMGQDGTWTPTTFAAFPPASSTPTPSWGH